MSSSDRVQTVRNAWINRVRDEALRMRRPEVSKCFQIGMIIATYADADGSNAFPASTTIAAIAGCTEETVTRCVKVLTAVGLLDRKRRPNKSAVYQLVLPLQRPDWAAHLHLYTDTRQARRKKAEKLKELETRNPFQNGIRNPFPMGVPEPVPAGVSEPSGTRSRTVPDPVPQRVPEPVPAGGDQYIPTSGRDRFPNHDMPGPVPQPQVVAGEPGQDDSSPHPTADNASSLPRCPDCDIPLLRPGRTTCKACEPATAGRTAS